MTECNFLGMRLTIFSLLFLSMGLMATSTMGQSCGDENAGDCCDPGGNGTPACDDLDCCEAVCAVDPFCCDNAWDTICAGEAADMCAICGPSDLTWFTNQNEFESFVQEQGKVSKGTENFEESILSPNNVVAFDDPLQSGIPNLPNGFPFPVGMTGLPNLIIQSNLGGANSANENPAGANALAAGSVGLLGVVVSDIVVTNMVEHSLDLIFTSEKTAVGFNTLSFNGLKSVAVKVYSTTNVFLGLMAVPADGAATNFIGVWSSVPIGRINIYAPGNGQEGADNIQAWQISLCGDAGAGSCFEEHPTPFCDNAACCNTVCAIDPFCCDTQWDGQCVGEAQELCAGCGDPGSGSCSVNNGTPGCDDAKCCAIVCDADPFCCETSWDGLCADAAAVLCDQAPKNDLCENAIGMSVPGFLDGTTNNATVDDGFPFCGTSITAPGVWYSVIGTGTTMTATTCSEFTGYDTKISVYCNDCNEPICVDGNNDDCDLFGELNSTVNWCSAVGVEYLILVHGFGNDTGVFDLSVTEDGVACGPPDGCAGKSVCDAGAGDCCDPKGNGTPGCEDVECCEIVCAVDPFCCDSSWDGLCADEAQDLCSLCGGAPCPWDLNGDNSVLTADLLDLLSQWGGPGSADFNSDGFVLTADLLEMLANWGLCP